MGTPIRVPSMPKERHEALRNYLLACYADADWHGVSDAANDLRELEAAHPDTKVA